MLPNLTKWKVYKGTDLVLETDSVSMSKDPSKNRDFYFEAPITVPLVKGDLIRLAMPIGTPTYTCLITNIVDVEGKAGFVQVQTTAR